MGRGVKTRKIVLNESGYFLSRKEGCFVVRNIRTKEEVAKYPILEKQLGEIQVISGNLISTGALVTAAFNRIPVIIKTACMHASPEISKLQKQLLALTYENLKAGEKIYDRFLDFHGCTLIGLQAAGLVPKTGELMFRFPRYRYFLNYSDLWNHFIFSIFNRFNFDDEFERINENMKQTLVKIKKHEEHLLSLMALPFRSKMVLVYLWGYPEIFHVSNKAFLPMFAEWFSALKAGYLDQRSWIFNEKSIIALINALKAVRRDKAPPDGIIDLVPWTIKDLYEYHHRGKDVDFWEELLRELKRQMQQKPSNQELCRHISAALEGRY